MQRAAQTARIRIAHWKRVLILSERNGVTVCDYGLHAPLLLLIRLAEDASLGAEFDEGKANLGETLTFLSGPLLA